MLTARAVTVAVPAPPLAAGAGPALITGMSAAAPGGAPAPGGAVALGCAVCGGEVVTDVTAPSLTSTVTRMAPLSLARYLLLATYWHCLLAVPLSDP